MGIGGTGIKGGQKNGSCCYYRRRYRCVKEQKHSCGTETRRRNRTSAFRGPPHEQRLEKAGIHTQKTGRRYPYCNGTYQYVLETDHTDIEGSGLFVSVVNAMLIHDFSDNTIRKLKTDRADALKIANYALTFWDTLPPFNSEEETRLLLKMQSRANERITATATALRNGLIALADQTFPGVA